MICRRYRPDDRAAVISVLRHSIAEWHGDWADPYWEWKFERNPHGEALIWVGEDDGRIAGCYIWNPVRIRLGTSTMLGAQSVDAATHSDYIEERASSPISPAPRGKTSPNPSLPSSMHSPSKRHFEGRFESASSHGRP